MAKYTSNNNPMRNNSAQARKNSSASPWRKYPTCETKRARESFEQFRRADRND